MLSIANRAEVDNESEKHILSSVADSTALQFLQDTGFPSSIRAWECKRGRLFFANYHQIILCSQQFVQFEHLKIIKSFMCFSEPQREACLHCLTNNSL